MTGKQHSRTRRNTPRVSVPRKGPEWGKAEGLLTRPSLERLVQQPSPRIRVLSLPEPHPSGEKEDIRPPENNPTEDGPQAGHALWAIHLRAEGAIAHCKGRRLDLERLSQPVTPLGSGSCQSSSRAVVIRLTQTLSEAIGPGGEQRGEMQSGRLGVRTLGPLRSLLRELSSFTEDGVIRASGC
ncbi:unnamed protein product [Rangifer tarandus platyrhynchus]|uniref:Uncharacterized protein n=1 Tax=Rangifer tarandus platyrhynchus TaxID=3082113 RepID=A0ABN8ZDP3_RANTA|nr:unnamed protein product [Rangifer tarandus platyrhynchus]